MGLATQYQNAIEPITATILSGQTESDEIPLYGTTIAGLFIPAAFTGATLTFLAKRGESDFVDMYDGSGGGVVLSKTIAADKYVPLSPTVFYGVRAIKIKSGASEAADREIQVMVYSI